MAWQQRGGGQNHETGVRCLGSIKAMAQFWSNGGIREIIQAQKEGNGRNEGGITAGQL